MNGYDTPRALYLVLLLVLVASSLIGMRLSAGKALKMFLAWVAIFAAAFVLFAFRGDFAALGQRLKAEATGSPIETGEEVRIPLSGDGHFWVNAAVNGTRARFLIDSGASITTISADVARAAGVTPGYRVPVETANGTIDMARASADRFALGPIERSGLTVFVNSQGSANVIGMNFLNSLAGWRVEGDYLVLRA